jgi:hypothetical protein
LSGVGCGPDGAEVVSGGEADVGVEGGGEAAQEGDGGLGAAFFDALDVVVGQGSAHGQLGDRQAESGADVVQGLAEGQGLADSDPLGISHLPFIGLRREPVVVALAGLLCADGPADLPLLVLAGLAEHGQQHPI